MKVRFYLRVPPDKHTEKGAAVPQAPLEYVHVEGLDVSKPDSKDAVVRRASEADKARWPHEYAAFQAEMKKRR